MRDLLTHAFWDHLALLAILVGLVASVAFVTRYQWEVRWGWWRFPDGHPNLFGRFLMERKLLLAGLFTLLLAGRVASGRIFQEVPDPFPGYGLLLAVLLWGFALQTFVPYRLLVLVHREHPRKEESHDGLRHHS